MDMATREQLKENFIQVVSELMLLYQQKEKDPLFDLTDLAAYACVDRNQLGRWMNETYPNLPGPAYAINLANFFVNELGAEGMKIYDALDWPRPRCPIASNSS